MTAAATIPLTPTGEPVLTTALRVPGYRHGMSRGRFRGAIAGVGTTSGVRVVVGRWDESPYGAFVDAMVETAAGHRALLAPTDQVAEFVATTYAFDAGRPGAPVRLLVDPETAVRDDGWSRPSAPDSWGTSVGSRALQRGGVHRCKQR
jgi:hypothetical protein